MAATMPLEIRNRDRVLLDFEEIPLSREYEAAYRDAAGNFRFANGVYEGGPFRPTCVFGIGFNEELPDGFRAEIHVLPVD